MVAVLKVLTIRDAVEALQAKFENAADVRRSRVALLAYLKDSPDIYWLHFTGKDAEAVLKKLNLFNQKCYATDFDKKYGVEFHLRSDD